MHSSAHLTIKVSVLSASSNCLKGSHNQLLLAKNVSPAHTRKRNSYICIMFRVIFRALHFPSVTQLQHNRKIFDSLN